MKIRRTKTLGTFIFLFYLMVSITACDSRQTAGIQESAVDTPTPALSVIEGAENATATISKGTNSYYTIDLSGLSSNGSITGKSGNGWLIKAGQQNLSNSSIHEGLSLYSTFESEGWKPINYLLNELNVLKEEIPGITYREIQAAIWMLLESPAFNAHQAEFDKLPSRMVHEGDYAYDREKADQIVGHVRQNYASFRYNTADKIALVVETADKQQPFFIEVDLDSDSDPGKDVEIVNLKEKYGFIAAWDINDHGQIVGGSAFWDEERGLVDMGSIFARSINAHEEVAGSGAVWNSASGLRDIDIPEPDREHSGHRSSWVEAYDINDHGTVVGEVVHEYQHDSFEEYEFSAFIWDDQNGLTRISEDGWARSINNNGQVVGVDYSLPDRTFIWDEESGIKSLGSYPGFSLAKAYAINNEGQVAGSILASKGRSKSVDQDEINRLLSHTRTIGIYDYGHVVEMIQNSTFDSEAFPWENERSGKGKTGGPATGETGMPISLNEVDDSLLTEALTGGTSYRSEAFIWNDRKGVSSLGTLGGDWSTAWDINDQGQAVGYSQISDGEHRAFFWDEQQGMVELPSLGGNSLARAINNEGQIVGYSYDSDGEFHSVMWDISNLENRELVAEKQRLVNR